MVSSALYKHIKEFAATAVLKDTTAYEKHCVPPDGLCCFHAILGSLEFTMWNAVSRTELGYATNRRTAALEAAKAHALRDLAISSTDETNPLLLSMAATAKEHLSVDVGELSWLGTVLNLSIRCTIDDEAGMFVF